VPAIGRWGSGRAGRTLCATWARTGSSVTCRERRARRHRCRWRTGSHNGHGLGLSIVAAIAAAHGGELRLYAREQGGLGAEVTLPVVPDPQPAS